MNIPSITLIYFSPTGTTKTIVEEIAHGIHAERVEVIDCTKPSIRAEKPLTFRDELVILGAPVYSGRIPTEAADYFKTLSAQKTPAVLVAVYGNRAYEDALKELHDIAINAGFLPVAGGAFIGEHSFSSKYNVPDKLNLKFRSIKNLLKSLRYLPLAGIQTVFKLIDRHKRYGDNLVMYFKRKT